MQPIYIHRNSIIIFLLVFSTTLLIAQEKGKFSTDIETEIKGKHIINGINQEPIYDNSNNFTTDNPLNHFAIYGKVNSRFTYDRKYYFDLGIFIEERNHSSGSLKLNQIAIFPKITFGINDTIRVFKKKIVTKLKAGDLWNENFNDKLRFYNIDFHGFTFSLQFDKYAVSIYKVSDLSGHIGLNLPEATKIAFEFENDNFLNSSSITINEFFRNMTYPSKDLNIGNYLSYKAKSNIEYIFQISARINKSQNTSYSILLGNTSNYENISLKTVIRYYQSNFNKYYKQDLINRYTGNGFKGNYLYPLKNYFRPYSQWALYTDKQNSELAALEIQFEYDKHLFDKLFISNQIDINILKELNTGQIEYYPAYDIGLKIKYLKSIFMKFSLTNKHMNLDSYFHTFYLSKRPYFSFELNFKTKSNIR